MSSLAQVKTKMRKSENTGFYAFLLGLCALLYARDVLQMPLPLPIFVVYFAIGYICFDYTQSLAITAMLLLLGHGIQINYIFLIATAVYLYKYGKGFKLTLTHGIVAILMGLELLHMAYPPFVLSDYIRYLVQYMYIALILGDNRLPKLLKDPLLVLRAFIFMATYFMIDVISVTARYIDITEILAGKFRFGVLDEFLINTATLYDNENTVGLFALLAICFLMICMIKTRKHYLRDGLLIAYFLYFGLLTQSKTFLLCLLLVAVMYYIYWLRIARKSAVKAIVVSLVIVFAVHLTVNVLFADALSGVLARFEAKDLSTGRADLFEQYNEFILKSPANMLWGAGLQGIKEKTGIWNTPHNGLQEILVCWGLIGMLLFVCLFMDVYQRAKRITGGKMPFWCKVPFVIHFIYIQTMQFVRVGAGFGMLTILYIAVISGGGTDEKSRISDHR